MLLNVVNLLVVATEIEGQLKMMWQKPLAFNYSHVHVYVSNQKGTLGTLVGDNQTGVTFYYQGLPESRYYVTVKGVDINGSESTYDKQLECLTWALCNKVSTKGTFAGTVIWSVTLDGFTRSTSDFGKTYTEAPNNLPTIAIDYYVNIAKNGTMLVSKGREVFRAVYPYVYFTKVLSLSTTASVVRSWGFTEDSDGNLYMSEYANYKDANGDWVNLIVWYNSSDDGLTWSANTNLQYADNKHIHQLKINPFTGIMYATTGDTNKLLFKSSDRGVNWEQVVPVSFPSQDGNNINYAGFTGIGFFETREIIWGTDWAPKNPDTSQYWNWFVRSEGDDVTSFKYDKMDYKYYGMCNQMVTDPHTGEAWSSLMDEFNEIGVNPVLMYTANKGVNWKPVIELPADNINGIDSRTILGTDTNHVGDTGYIFWEISGVGVIRLPRKLELDTYDELTTMHKVKMLQNINGVISRVNFVTNNNSVITKVTLLTKP